MRQSEAKLLGHTRWLIRSITCEWNRGDSPTTGEVATQLDTQQQQQQQRQHYRVDAVLLTAQVERLYSSSAEAGFRAAAPVGVGVTQLQVRQQEMVVGSARRRSHQTLCAKLPQLAKQPVARALSLSLRVCLRSCRSKTVTVI